MSPFLFGTKLVVDSSVSKSAQSEKRLQKIISNPVFPAAQSRLQCTDLPAHDLLIGTAAGNFHDSLLLPSAT
jgi:hypothetical protein